MTGSAGGPTPVAAREGQTLRGQGMLLRHANLVRLPHTIFALPFALVGVVLASYVAPITIGNVVWVVVAFTSARFAAMGFNRIADREIDARNPRTRSREIPSGTISVREASAAMDAVRHHKYYRRILREGMHGSLDIAAILINGVYPAIVQNFVVTPDELNAERPYIERNIAATRAAYSLDKIEESLFNVADTPSQAEAQREFSDPLSVRLWDWRRLLSDFGQIQALKPYYDFNDGPFGVAAVNVRLTGDNRVAIFHASMWPTGRSSRRAGAL